jgi:hypothetical protein
VLDSAGIGFAAISGALSELATEELSTDVRILVRHTCDTAPGGLTKVPGRSLSWRAQIGIEVAVGKRPPKRGVAPDLRSDHAVGADDITLKILDFGIAKGVNDDT